jgi:hypothetical protein
MIGIWPMTPPTMTFFGWARADNVTRVR